MNRIGTSIQHKERFNPNHKAFKKYGVGNSYSTNSNTQTRIIKNIAVASFVAFCNQNPSPNSEHWKQSENIGPQNMTFHINPCQTWVKQNLTFDEIFAWHFTELR
jgi:hypothetical protein